MRIMGVDYGDARTGIAMSDLLCSIVGSTTVIHSRNMDKTLEEVVRLVKENQVTEICVGLPKNMDGSEGNRAETVGAFIELLRAETDIAVDTMDERMTTMIAYRYLGASEVYGKKRKDAVDTLSAQIILQDYIDRERKEKA